MHRFWLVLAATLTGGTIGLWYGAEYGLQPLVAGLLLAVTLGALALALMRVLLFLAGGVAAAWLAHVVAPAWGEPAPVVGFLVGGLAGVVLYRVWVCALSALAGTLLIAYSILCLTAKVFAVDMAAWAAQQAAVLTWVCAAFSVLGVLVQLLLERRSAKRRREREAAANEAEEAAPPPPPPPKPKPWWEWEVFPAKKKPRKAG
jgi:hypothetical protein